jgi:hypothetical protein
VEWVNVRLLIFSIIGGLTATADGAVAATYNPTSLDPTVVFWLVTASMLVVLATVFVALGALKPYTSLHMALWSIAWLLGALNAGVLVAVVSQRAPHGVASALGVFVGLVVFGVGELVLYPAGKGGRRG